MVVLIGVAVAFRGAIVAIPAKINKLGPGIDA
jgi:hypothetical protein